MYEETNFSGTYRYKMPAGSGTGAFVDCDYNKMVA